MEVEGLMYSSYCQQHHHQDTSIEEKNRVETQEKSCYNEIITGTSVNITWKGKLLRCHVDLLTPVLWPVLDSEEWNDIFITCKHLKPGELVLCIEHTEDTLEVLYDEMIWKTDAWKFEVCNSFEEYECYQEQ